MKISISLLLIVYLSFTAGCGNISNRASEVVEPEREVDVIMRHHEDLVAINLVSALSQLHETQPRTTTVQFTEPKTDLGLAVVNGMQDAGYGLQLVNFDVGSNYARYRYENSITESGPVTRYSLSIGSVKAERNYILKNGSIHPDSEMFISGAEEVEIKNNDFIFEGQGGVHSYASDTSFERNITPEEVTVDNSVSDTQSADPSVLSNVTQNMNDINAESNYAALFDGFTDIESIVLVFPDDEMSIGPSNKQVLQRMASAHNQETDIFSVIGCSHGDTAITAGNAVLATGRSNRVKEELIFAEVPHTQIFNEGCWAEDFVEGFPARGVLLTLKRRNP